MGRDLWSARRVRQSALAALLLGVVTAGPRAAAGQVSVDQAELFVDPTAPGPHVTAFDVTNEGSSVVEVSIYLGDWDRREDGEHRFVASGTLPHSCAKYLQVFPLSLRLPPGARQAVRVALQNADSIKTACWSVAFVEHSAPGAAPGRQITYVTRLGVKIYVIPPGLPKEGEVVDFAVQARPVQPARRTAPADSGGRQIALTFRNTGGVPLWVHGSVEYRRADNSVAATDSVAEFPVLPDAWRTVTRPVPRLAAGKYVALTLLDYGGAEIAAGQITVDVP
jgi:hypothetical protein